jgi:hypothetical protein
MEVFQCPECALRFRNESELKQHLSFDHPDFDWNPATIEDALISSARRRKHTYHGPRESSG